MKTINLQDTIDVLVPKVVKASSGCKTRIQVIQKAMGVILFQMPGGRALSDAALGALAEDLAESACLQLNIPC